MKHLSREKGQGLVEYALILVLVAIVVIAVLLLLGPVIGNVFSNITAELLNPTGGGGGSQDSGAITGVSIAKITGSIQVTVSVSKPTTVSVSATSGTIDTPTKSCSGSCKFVIESPGASGTATATGGGSTKKASW